MLAGSTSVGRVLLVDDDPLVCDSIRRMLEVDRQQVQITNSAKEALAIAEKETFDLVILDYLMPEIKGDQLALTLRERHPHWPIIMITADAEKVEKPDERPPGVDLLVAKPFRLNDLREAILKLSRKD